MEMLPVPLNNRLDGPISPPERSQPKMIPQPGAPRTQSFYPLPVSRIDCKVPIDYTRIGTSRRSERLGCQRSSAALVQSFVIRKHAVPALQSRQPERQTSQAGNFDWV
jgi:hypothetical protein